MKLDTKAEGARVAYCGPWSPERRPEHAGLSEPHTMTIPAATRFSGLSKSTLLRRLAAGDIEARKAGRRTLIMFESLKAYLDQLPRAQFQ